MKIVSDNGTRANIKVTEAEVQQMIYIYERWIKTLSEEKKQLKDNIDEAIAYIKHSWRLKFDQVYDTSKYLSGWEAEELLSILERGKE